MSTIIMNKCWPLEMSPAQKSVLISLADNSSDEGVCWPSIKTICKRTCLSERSVQRAINWLEDQDILVRDLRYKRSTVYEFNLDRLDNFNPVTVTPDRVTGDTVTPSTPSLCRINPVTVTPRTIIEPPIEPSPLVDDENIDQLDDAFEEKTQPISDKHKKPKIPYQKIVELYESILPELPCVNLLTETRKAHIRARWHDHQQHQNLEFWQDYFSLVKKSPFLLGKVAGKNGGKPFRANLDWLINSSNFVKVTEGNYV